MTTYVRNATTTTIASIVAIARERGAELGADHAADHHAMCDCWPTPLSGEMAGESMPEIYHDLTGRDYSDDWDRAVDNPRVMMTPDDLLDAYEDAYVDAYLEMLTTDHHEEH